MSKPAKSLVLSKDMLAPVAKPSLPQAVASEPARSSNPKKSAEDYGTAINVRIAPSIAKRAHVYRAERGLKLNALIEKSLLFMFEHEDVA